MKILNYNHHSLFLWYNHYGDTMKKKIIISLTTLFILTGCSQNKQISNNITEIPNTEEPEIKEEIYIDDNPIKIALYKGKNKVTSYSTSISNFKDIETFNIYYTNIDKLDSTNIKNNYQKYYNQYENITDYKNGFYITFEAEGKKIEHLILDPTSKHAMTPYLYVYLYDSINQKAGTYYSHLEPEDMKENTIISSIKLFLAQEGTKISSPITFTAFTYNGEEDFDESGLYRGNSSYTIEITLTNKKW